MAMRRRKFINRWLTWITFGICAAAFWILFGEPKSPEADPDFYGDQYVEDISLGVLDFTANGVEASEATEISDRLRSYLKRTRRMHVYMKNEVDYAVQMAGEVSDIELGKVLRADLIITGTVSRDGRRYQLEAKIIDASNGLTLGQCHAEASGFENFLTQVTETVAGTLATALQGGNG